MIIESKVFREKIFISLNNKKTVAEQIFSPFESTFYKENKTEILGALFSTREITDKKQNLSAEIIKEYSILYIIIIYPDIIKNNFQDNFEVVFNSKINEELKKSLISSIQNKEILDFEKILADNNELIQKIKSSVNIKSILRSKSERQILEFLKELIFELKDIYKSKKLESFEKKLLNNFDENSYSELLKLKSQLNGE